MQGVSSVWKKMSHERLWTRRSSIRFKWHQGPVEGGKMYPFHGLSHLLFQGNSRVWVRPAQKSGSPGHSSASLGNGRVCRYLPAGVQSDQCPVKNTGQGCDPAPGCHGGAWFHGHLCPVRGVHEGLHYQRSSAPRVRKGAGSNVYPASCAPSGVLQVQLHPLLPGLSHPDCHLAIIPLWTMSLSFQPENSILIKSIFHWNSIGIFNGYPDFYYYYQLDKKEQIFDKISLGIDVLKTV